MERAPKFEMIGSAPEEEKEKAKEELYGLLFSHVEHLSEDKQEQVKKYEFPKTPEENLIIGFSNEETNRLRTLLGLQPYTIPTENYHIIPRRDYNEFFSKNSKATTYFDKQAIIFDAESVRPNPLLFGSTALHETLHLKGFFAQEVEEIEDKKEKTGKRIKKTAYREGVSVGALQKHDLSGDYHKHFKGLHEAIVSTQQKKSFQRLLELPEMAEYKNWMTSEEAIRLKAEKSQEKREKDEDVIPDDEFIWISKDKKIFGKFPYPDSRRVLAYLCTEIKNQFPDKYQTSDDVFNEFLKSHFTGNLLTIARLVEKTFGEGSFRMLGNMTEKSDNAVLHLESFRKARMRKLKKESD